MGEIIEKIGTKWDTTQILGHRSTDFKTNLVFYERKFHYDLLSFVAASRVYTRYINYIIT